MTTDEKKKREDDKNNTKDTIMTKRIRKRCKI